MKKMILISGLLILLIAGFAPILSAQGITKGQYAVSVNGGYSQPVAELYHRFKGTYNIDGALNYGVSNRLTAEIRLVYGRFDKLSSNPSNLVRTTNNVLTTYTLPPGMKHYYRYVGLTPSMMINLITEGSIKPYILLGTGWYRYDWYRGAATPYIRSYAPGNPLFQDWHWFTDAKGVKQVPYYAKHIDNYSWGLNGGLGLAIQAGSNMIFDVKARWEVVLADIWPALFLGLEEVRPIQNLQLTAGIRFIL